MQLSCDEFCALLREKGGYRTPSGIERSLADRLFGRFDIWYYANLFGIVFRAYLKALMGRFGARAWTGEAYRAMRLVERCGGRVDISGVDEVARLNGPAVFAANHMSLLETFVLPGLLILPIRDVGTAVKRGLLRYPIFGRVLRSVDPIVVGRRNAREDLTTMLRQGVDFLRGGRSLVVFPQATRRKVFDPTQFNSMGVKLAGRARAPLVSVAVETGFHGVGWPLKDIGRIDRSKVVHFAFGPALPVEGVGRKAHEQSVSFIVERLRSWGGAVADAGPESSARASSSTPISQSEFRDKSD